MPTYKFSYNSICHKGGACIAILALCSTLLRPLSAQQPSLEPMQTNMDLLETLAEEACVSINGELRKFPYDKYAISLETHPANWLIEQCLIGSGITLFAEDAATTLENTARLKMRLKSCSVVLRNGAERDSLIRTAEISLAAHIQRPNGQLTPIAPFMREITDVIHRTETAQANNVQYAFARANIPEPPSDFFSDIAEPLVIVSAAALTVFLLFTVRTQ